MIRVTTQGLYCEAGNFHIDPNRPVEIALITHAHSDHARRGSRQYVCVNSSLGLMRSRLGRDISLVGVPYRNELRFGEVRVSFHPAGHILGSAQIRLEHRGEIWVVSGDYKRDADPSCEPFEPIRCDTFVTEATFGQPAFRWGDPSLVMREIYEWWQGNAERGRNSLLYCYALGKTQRVLAGLRAFTERPVWVYGEAAELTDCYRGEGVEMVPTLSLDRDAAARTRFRGELIIAPHSIARSPWISRLGDCQTAFASGWMRGGGFERGSYDRGFVLSDHADWPALIRTIEETGARQVLVLHGKDGSLIRHLRKKGIDASLFSRHFNSAGARLGAQLNLF